MELFTSNDFKNNSKKKINSKILHKTRLTPLLSSQMRGGKDNPRVL